MLQEQLQQLSQQVNQQVSAYTNRGFGIKDVSSGMINASGMYSYHIACQCLFTMECRCTDIISSDMSCSTISLLTHHAVTLTVTVDNICGMAHHVHIYHATLLGCFWTVYVCAVTNWLCLNGQKETCVNV